MEGEDERGEEEKDEDKEDEEDEDEDEERRTRTTMRTRTRKDMHNMQHELLPFHLRASSWRLGGSNIERPKCHNVGPPSSRAERFSKKTD